MRPHNRNGNQHIKRQKLDEDEQNITVVGIQ